ncbi:MAG: hypothetical protein ACJAQT_005142 [Akkermansiaceae bacterium]|jgi:hypothetical protein
MNGIITNALIRCTREDEIAHPVFEKVRNDLDIWVLELPEILNPLITDLTKHLPLLKQLRTNSSDYTLHLAVTIDEHRLISIPPSLSGLAHECGFSIEVVVSL